MEEIINSQNVQFIIKNGYLMMFVLMVLEGPIITFFSAFIASSLGIFDITTIIILGILGDIVGDMIYYCIGRSGCMLKITRSCDFVEKLKKLLEKKPFLSVALIKYTPYMQPPGLIFTGFSKFSVKHFILFSMILSIPGALIFGLGGYFFGGILFAIYSKINNPFILVPITLFVIGGLLLAYRKGTSAIAQKIEKNEK